MKRLRVIFHSPGRGKVCPVCGKHRFTELGKYEICPVCGWEDDPIQVKDPDFAGGANSESLNEYRKKYLEGRNNEQ